MIEHKFPNAGPSFPTKLINLPDVDDTTSILGQVPVFNSSTLGFTLTTLNVGYIGSIDISDNTNGYVLTWNTSTNTLDLQASASGVAWGAITGTLSAQTDLNTALGLKAPLASPTFTGTVGGVTATMVGLGSVDNTSDATKNAASVTLTNKALSDSTTTLVNVTDATKKIKFNISGNTTSITGTIASAFTTAKTITLPDATDTLAGVEATQTLKNKTLDNTNTITCKADGSFVLQDSIDATKQLWFRLTNIPTSTTRVMLIPEGGADDTLTSLAAAQTLSNKTLTKPIVNGSTDALTGDTDGATITFNMAASNVHWVQLGGDRTLALSNVTVGQRFTLILQQDPTGTRLVTWFTTINWSGATAPTLTTSLLRYDVFEFLCISAGNYIEIRRLLNVGL